jgi:hypothetical protein
MRIRNFLWLIAIGAMSMAITCLPACGGGDDDDFESTGGTQKTTGAGGTKTSSASGGSSAGASGINDIIGWLRDGGLTVPTEECAEAAPTSPIPCGATSCNVQSTYLAASCLFACCATDKNGQQVCGVKDATKDTSEPCQAEPVADSRCPDVTYSDTGAGRAGSSGSAGAAGGNAGGTVLKGCCNPENKCGIISSLRPLCVTKSTLIDLPATPKACDAP